MKSTILTRVIIIIVLLIGSLYLLYPTIKYATLSPAEKKQMELSDPKSFMELKSKSINLGLDLQGGMHVILEVDIQKLIDNLAKNKNDVFVAALNETAKEVATSDEDFVTVLNTKLKEKGSNSIRFFSSSENRTEEDVIEYLHTQSKEAVQRSLEILRNRVDEFGVTEPIIQMQGDHRIILELAGVSDPGRVRKLIGKTALLEFQLLKDNMVTAQVAEKISNYINSRVSPSDTLAGKKSESDTSSTALEEMFGINDSAQKNANVLADSASGLFETNMIVLHPRDRQTLLVPVEKEQKFKRILELPEIQKMIIGEAGAAEFLWSAKPVFEDKYYQLYLVSKAIELTGSTITDAHAQTGDQSDPTAIGKFEVSLSLNDDGAKVFSRVTGANIGKRLAIVLDKKVYLAPELRVKITGGRARVTGLDTMEEAKDLGIVLKAGALPAPVAILAETTVGPSLGQDSIDSGTISALIGLTLVILYMGFYYKIAGIVADFALLLNLPIIMAVMAYFNATLTLPGIAGIILTIGMSVDANVLINERVREEMRRGKTPRACIQVGYDKAFVTILDSNLTTFISGLVLYTYGTGPVQGFALTLMIGIISSMFTSIVVTRVIFDYALDMYSIKKLSV
jgi:preprotein translocase subunit SecD